MGKSLTEIAQQLKNANKKVQLIYAFNGTGKTRLSREFRYLIAPKSDSDEDAEQTELARTKILYYNAFTEDLFYWDNDLERDAEPKLKFQPNSFTDWVLKEQGQDQNIIANFQRYTNEKLTPKFSSDFSEVTFSYMRGNDETPENIKISKGEESNFIWSVFYSLLEQVIGVLNTTEASEPETQEFDKLEYVFIDDPVSSLDENHLIELAVDLAQLIKSNQSELKFIITSHNPLFYNVLHNEFKKDAFM
jgi:wobble nucleotide-excising tRNase